MNALWTSATAAAATGAQACGADWVASGVSIDTRTLVSGDLFVALADRRDGHDFVADALARGAAAALVSRRPEGLRADAPLLVVPDVLAGLRDLARAARARTRARVIAVTGSVGKTSTKEMLRAALAGQGAVHAAEASYNNHWGVPLTLARMPANADHAVIEIGMNAPGEIAPLARLARPHVALITAVAPAHLEAFADVAAIAREKAAITEGLGSDGIVIVNGDLDTTFVLTAAARAAGVACETFGSGTDCTHRLLELGLGEGVTVVRADIAGRPVLFRLMAAGRHLAMNGLAALAGVRALGGDLAQAACALGHWCPPAGRGTRQHLLLDPADPDSAFTLIDDAFNANPASVSAALEGLAVMRPTNGVGRREKGRRIAILGDMLELGPREGEMHAALAALPAMAAVDVVHCVGSRMRSLYGALPVEKRGRWVETAGELCQQASRLIDAGDVVLVKGSKGIAVSRVAETLRRLAHPAEDEQGKM